MKLTAQWYYLLILFAALVAAVLLLSREKALGVAILINSLVLLVDYRSTRKIYILFAVIGGALVGLIMLWHGR